MSHLQRALIVAGALVLGACQSTSVTRTPVETREADRVEVPPLPLPEGGDVPHPALSDAPGVIKSPNDDRDYRFVTLDNQLKVLLVSDPDTDKAAASLTVFRGSYHEPDDYPGLAHFLEHMLFIGTEKYPTVDAYQEFIGQHGGSSNAYTAGDHTNYFFDIQPSHFRPAMDRFAQFFISPLLAADYVEREKNAVHSEYQLQLKADNWRAGAVMSEVVNPDHPEARFSIGSLDTLGPGVGEALVEFFETEYSADQMVLVALSNESLDAMDAWIRPMFSQIDNLELGPDPVDQPLFVQNDLPATVRYRTIKEGYKVAFNFPVPATERYYRQKPADYVANLLGHEGRGSLYQKLQSEGWIESLAAGTGSYDEINSLLVVDVSLTDSGYHNLDRVSDAVFDFIDTLKAQAPQAWRYREQARIAELGFRFQEQSSASSFVYQVAPRFMHYPPEDVLVAPYLMTDFDPALIQAYLDALRPDNVVMEIAGPDVPVTAREPWFDVPYDLAHEPPPRRPEATAGLSLPAPNPYLPSNLRVLPDDPEPPRLAVARPGLALWADRDTEFNTPRANLYLSLGVPRGIATPEDLALASLYARLVEDALSEAVYPAYLAGLGYSLDVDGYGFEVKISGYSDKQLTLLGTVLDALTDTAVDPERFEVLRQELIRDWRNYREDRPYSQAYGALGYLMLSNRWPPDMLVAELENITPATLTTWLETRATTFHVLGLHHGNVPVESAWALASELQEYLELGAFKRQAPQVVNLAGSARYQLQVDHSDAAMVLYLQDPDASVESRARSALAASMMRQAYFTSLRTEQQLGYVVALNDQTLRDRGGLAFIVQSPVASAAELERATQAFVTEQADAVHAMSEEAFAGYKQGLISRLTERDRNVVERGRRLWTNLDLGVTTFDMSAQLAAAVAELSKADMAAFISGTAAGFDDHRLLVYSNGQFEEAPTDGTALHSVRDFKGAR